MPSFTAGLTGVVLALGLTTLIVGCAGTPEAVPVRPAESGEWIEIFDGSDVSGWKMAGPGLFELQRDGSLLSRGGMGLFYYAERPFRDFEMELEWKAETDTSNSGVFVRFPDTDDPWVAVREGHEIQIYDRGDPYWRTGALYDTSSSWRLTTRPAGEWNQMRVRVAGQRYEVWVNDEKVNDFISDRSREGHVGIQNHGPDENVWFRNVRVRALPPGGGTRPESLAELFAVTETREPIRVLMLTATHGFRHEEAIPVSRLVMEEIETSTEFDFDVTEDLAYLHRDSLARYDILFFANTTLRRDGGRSGRPVTEAQQQAIMDFLADGKGIVGAHAAADAFYDWDDYRAMLGGGLFESHPWTQSVRLRVEAREDPVVAHFGDGFWIRDEIYVLDQNPRETSTVLVALDMESVNASAEASGGVDHPISWTRLHNGGRVFYTKLGHFADVWSHPGFIQHLLQGMRWSASREPENWRERFPAGEHSAVESVAR